MANVPHTASNRAPSITSTGCTAAQRVPFSTSTKVGGKANTNSRAAVQAVEAPKPVQKARSEKWAELPSARIKSIKCADPFATKSSAFKTKFGGVFSSGGIPCRLHHGAVKVKLHWSRDPSTLDYDPLLVTCAEVCTADLTVNFLGTTGTGVSSFVFDRLSDRVLLSKHRGTQCCSQCRH